MTSNWRDLPRLPCHGQPAYADPTNGVQPLLVVGRYALYDEIASGGMATVHFGRHLREFGFSRTVAIKRMHAHIARDPDFAMFVDEARILNRIRHPNVVPFIDVVSKDGELLLVMEYVAGETLSRICLESFRAGRMIPPRLLTAVFVGVLEGLHAAHEAVSETGVPLAIVHRDVSPQNIMVGQDGVARVIDWGVATAVGRMQTTHTGQIKGKISYMAPEQITGVNVDRRADVYSTGITMWELLTGRRLFKAPNDVARLHAVLNDPIPPPGVIRPSLPSALNDVVVRATQRDPALRFNTAREMAVALENAVRPATSRDVARWVEQIAGASLRTRSARVAEIENVSGIVPLCKDAGTSGVQCLAPGAWNASDSDLSAPEVSSPGILLPRADAPRPLALLSAHMSPATKTVNLLPPVPKLQTFRRRVAIAAAVFASGLACSVAPAWAVAAFSGGAAELVFPSASLSASATGQPPAPALPDVPTAQ
ncbi:MAG: serine/threonine protein kinase, partial [Polyangiaceae bacterium]|nr:serine/threonine protein kinase [Polyangiaceae bacterium]